MREKKINKKKKGGGGGWGAGNSTELQKPNVKAEVYNNKKCDLK